MFAMKLESVDSATWFHLDYTVLLKASFVKHGLTWGRIQDVGKGDVGSDLRKSLFSTSIHLICRRKI